MRVLLLLFPRFHQSVKDPEAAGPQPVASRVRFFYRRPNLPACLSTVPPSPSPLARPLQLEEWEADPSPGQLSLVEAVREVLAALLKDLTRNNR
jgi:hypothetical protein